MEDRLKDLALRGVVWILGLFVAAYPLSLAAVFLASLARSSTRAEAVAYWKRVAASPLQVERLLVQDRQVKAYALGIVTVLGCVWLISIMGGEAESGRPTVSSRYGSHGTGRWATKEEVTREFPESGAGAILGRIRSGRQWRTVIFPWSGRPRNRFLLIIGPPGSGKTSRYSLPNLVHAAHEDPSRSLVITDPKAELYRQTARLFADRGYEIRTVNLVHPAASDRYNPMEYVHTVEDAFRLANTIITNTSSHMMAGEAFWVNAERSLLACLIWYTRVALPAAQQHLCSVLYLGNAFAREPKLMEAIFSYNDLDPTAKALYRQVHSLSDKTRDGVFVGFAVRLQLWASPEIAALTAASDFRLRELGRKRIALYLIIPDHHSTYQALTSLFFDQAFQELIAEADERGGPLETEVRFMLEEMANIGRIPDLEKRLATIRSRGLLVEMILQTIGQLRGLYGEAWNTITGCADTLLALAANDLETAEWLSKRLGTTTIRTTSLSNTATDRGGSNSQSYHYTSRALMLPDEVMGQGEAGLQPDELLLIQRGIHPARLSKYPVDEFPGARDCVPMDPRQHEVKRENKEAVPLPDLDDLPKAELKEEPQQGQEVGSNQPGPAQPAPGQQAWLSTQTSTVKEEAADK